MDGNVQSRHCLRAGCRSAALPARPRRKDSRPWMRLHITSHRAGRFPRFALYIHAIAAGRRSLWLCVCYAYTALDHFFEPQIQGSISYLTRRFAWKQMRGYPHSSRPNWSIRFAYSRWSRREEIDRTDQSRGGGRRNESYSPEESIPIILREADEG
jgi:hypothetical protein